MADTYHRPTVSETDDQGNEAPAPETNHPTTPEAKPAGLTIVFRDASGGELSFKLKPTTKLKKAMDAFAQRTQRERHTLRFLFEGVRVLDEHSAEEVG